jgi:hypothetical protein
VLSGKCDRIRIRAKPSAVSVPEDQRDSRLASIQGGMQVSIINRKGRQPTLSALPSATAQPSRANRAIPDRNGPVVCEVSQQALRRIGQAANGVTVAKALAWAPARLRRESENRHGGQSSSRFPSLGQNSHIRYSRGFQHRKVNPLAKNLSCHVYEYSGVILNRLHPRQTNRPGADRPPANRSGPCHRSSTKARAPRSSAGAPVLGALALHW